MQVRSSVGFCNTSSDIDFSAEEVHERIDIEQRRLESLFVLMSHHAGTVVVDCCIEARRMGTIATGRDIHCSSGQDNIERWCVMSLGRR